VVRKTVPCCVQILTFTENFVFRVAFVVNNYEFDEEDCLNPMNVHYLLSMYTGSVTVVLIHKYIKDVQVSRHTVGWLRGTVVEVYVKYTSICIAHCRNYL